uniref:phospholipase A2 n=1 Tax=Pygocentrus nattereri TaxID=42514 RepID=A0A3B4CQW4_PYGNA
MRIRLCCLALVIILCHSSALHSDTWNQQYEPFCLTTKSVLGRTQCSFLRKSAATEPLLFYWTVWTADHRVEGCSISAERSLIENYLTLCREVHTWDSDGTQSLRLNISLLFDPRSPCKFRPSAVGNWMRQRRNLDLGHRVGAKSRQKRAWIFPGTLWCGRGSTAGDYEQLGMFEPVDRCCREHDHCSNIIRPFTVNFGVLNPSLFTISHCDCDNRFKQCLLKVNDTVSNMVGYTFFNILKLRCFDLIQKSHCTQLNWFGMCTTVRIAPFAILKNPTPYNLTNANSGTSGISDPPHEYQVYTSAKGKEKNMKPKRRKQSNVQRRIHAVALAKGDTLLLSEEMQQHYGKTKKLSPRTTILPSVWKIHKSELMQITPSPGPTRIIHTHTTLSQAKEFSAQIQMITSLTKNSTNRRKATTSQNATIQIKLVQTSRKPPKSKHNCDNMKPPRDFNFQSTQEKGKEYKVDNASKLKSLHTTVSPKLSTTSWVNIFPRTGRVFVNKTQPSKKAILSIRASAPPKNTVSVTSKQKSTSVPQKKTVSSTKTTETLRSPLICDAFRYLDDCKYRIGPMENIYGHRNMESTTIYHCDCIYRFTNNLKQLKKSSILQFLLGKFVSLSCIEISNIKECNKTTGCSAILSKTTELDSSLKKMKEDQADTKHIKQLINKRASRKLYKYCLRILNLRNPKHVKKSPFHL